jgi:hypothetical protein
VGVGVDGQDEASDLAQENWRGDDGEDIDSDDIGDVAMFDEFRILYIWFCGIITFQFSESFHYIDNIQCNDNIDGVI